MKNNIFRIFILVFGFTLLGTIANAQDPAFSQFYSNPLYLNPALLEQIMEDVLPQL